MHDDKMPRPWVEFLVVFSFVIGSIGVGANLNFAQGPKIFGDEIHRGSRGGIATLYSHDPLARALCFNDGGEGSVLVGYEVRNRCSHLRVEIPLPPVSGSQEKLRLGCQGAELGYFVDLGAEDDLTKRLGYFSWPGRAFSSIHLQDGRLVILKDVKREKFEELKEATALLAFSADSTNTVESFLPIQVGHVLIGRILDRQDKNLSLWVKVLILAYKPGESVTLRWQLM